MLGSRSVCFLVTDAQGRQFLGASIAESVLTFHRFSSFHAGHQLRWRAAAPPKARQDALIPVMRSCRTLGCERLQMGWNPQEA